MKTVTDNGVMIHANITLPYSLRLKANIHKINISEITRNALEYEIESIENGVFRK